jgi:hypothetical protein
MVAQVDDTRARVFLAEKRFAEAEPYSTPSNSLSREKTLPYLLRR